MTGPTSITHAMPIGLDTNSAAQTGADRLLMYQSLKPELQRAYDTSFKKLGYPPDIYIDWERNKGDAVFVTGQDGGQNYQVPITGFHWTPALLHTLLPTDETMKANTPLDSKRQGIIDAYSAYLKVPHVQVLLTDRENGTGMELTQEGHLYLWLEQKFLKDPALPGIIAHEFGHVVKKHYDVDTHVAAFNRADAGVPLQRVKETAADDFAEQQGVGKLLVQFLAKAGAADQREAAKKHETLEEYYKENPHLPPAARIADIVKAMHDHPATLAADNPLAQLQPDLPKLAAKNPSKGH